MPRKSITILLMFSLLLFHNAPPPAKAEVTAGALVLWQMGSGLYAVGMEVGGVMQIIMTATAAEVTTIEGTMVLNIAGLQRLAAIANAGSPYAAQIGLFIEQTIALEASILGEVAAFVGVGGAVCILFALAILGAKYVMPVAVAAMVPNFWGVWTSKPMTLAQALLTNLSHLNEQLSQSCTSCVSGMLSWLPQNNLLNPIALGCAGATGDERYLCDMYVETVNKLLNACGGSGSKINLYTSVGNTPDVSVVQPLCSATPTAIAPPLGPDPQLSCPSEGTYGPKYKYFADVCDPTNQQKMIGTATCDVNTNTKCTQETLNAVCFCASNVACSVNSAPGKTFCGGSTSGLSTVTQTWDDGYYAFTRSCDSILRSYYGNKVSYGAMCCPCGQSPTGSCDATQQRCRVGLGSAVTPVPAPIPPRN